MYKVATPVDKTIVRRVRGLDDGSISDLTSQFLHHRVGIDHQVVWVSRCRVNMDRSDSSICLGVLVANPPLFHSGEHCIAQNLLPKLDTVDLQSAQAVVL